MTIEEAIKTIEIAIAEVEWVYPTNYAAAFDIATSSLRAQQQLESNLKVLESNEPLTVDKPLEMDGEPVYIHSDTFSGDCGWRVVKKASVLYIQFTDGDYFLFTFYGKSWIAYRRKPKEAQE